MVTNGMRFGAVQSGSTAEGEGGSSCLGSKAGIKKKYLKKIQI